MSLPEMEVIKMREILFRGKLRYGKGWIYGNYIKGGSLDSICEGTKLFKAIVPETRGEFTGLTDKNGTKIFEGDILRAHHDNSEKTLVGIVKYGRYTDDEGEGEWDYLGWYIDVSGYCSSVLIPESLDIAIEVIGNIHDNPELIGGAENG